MAHFDDSFYLSADRFFEEHKGYGLTYDDVSLATCYSNILPKETSLETTLSESLTLPIPILSSDMDTVTEAGMAIALARHGGMGLIHYNLPEEQQVAEVARVKNNIHGLIQDPIKVSPDLYIADVLDKVAQKNYRFRTFPVVDENNVLLGLLAGRVVKERYRNKTVREAMTPRDQVFTITEEEITKDPILAADQFFNEHMGIHKLLVVDREDHLKGLFTISDVERIVEEQRTGLKPARDSKFRLVCGAAISAPRTSSGGLDTTRIINQASALIHEGVDALVVSTAHAHTIGVGETVKLLRTEFPDITLIAGNVTSAAAVEFLAEAGANAVKIGQGPGSACTTRVVAGVGCPQLTALYLASKASTKKKVHILADGGISKSADIVKALTLSEAVVCGNLFAGCKEAPGEILEINGKFYKRYRGMASLGAMKAGSAARYGHDKKDVHRKAAAEGVEALKEASEPIDCVITQLVGGLRSGMGYLGANTLSELKDKARYIRVTPAGQKESAPHNIIEVKETTTN